MNQNMELPGELPHLNIVIDRPWGSYKVIATGEGFQVKILVIHAGRRLSDQRHQHRSETWLPIGGDLHTGDHRIPEGTSFQIAVREWHRLENRNERDITVLEIQTGDYFGEDDIERRADDYGRA